MENIRPGGAASLEDRRKMAKQVFEGLAYFSIMRSPSPELQDAIDKLQILRCQVQEILDKVAPGWSE